jgi:hypothetical protein
MRYQFMASHKLAWLTFNLMCRCPLGKNPIFPQYCGAYVGISASLANASAAMFQLPTLKHVETCVDMTTDAKHFILCS